MSRTDQAPAPIDHAPQPRGNRAPQKGASWERRLVARLLASVGNPPVRFVLWNGDQLDPPNAEPIAEVRIHDRAALIKLLLDPDLHFGDGYTEGRIDVKGDLAALITETYRRMSTPAGRSWRLRRRNTLSGSRDNIHHHYDVGNDFYKLWLDERMVYTCAYFETPDATLEQAQLAKMDYVCRKLELTPGESVVEAGCGWGSLSLFMAANYGVRVRAFNISHEQIAWARDRARAEGLADRVEFVEDDYRNIAGKHDAFVSVGMLEHVGVANYEGLGAVIDRALTPAGRGLIHSIGRHKPMGSSRWLESRIFPGAEQPALSEMLQVLEPHNFAVLDVENLRLHYAQTLRHWLDRFERAADKIEAMFDDRFVRTYRLYLAASLATFASGWAQLFQVVFNRFQNNDIPRTRAHLYTGQPRSPW